MTLPNARILIIDDEERVRQACRRVLEPEGYAISEAAHGRQGLVMIQKDKPDLVLVDLMMPVMDGTEVLGALRRDYPDLAVVVITGYATMDRAVEAMKLGADDFLAKPFRPQDLRLVVDRALRRVRTLEDLATEKSRYRVLVQELTNGVLVVDAAGQVALANPALRRLLECEGDCHQRPAEEVLPCPEVVAALGAVLAGPRIEPVTAACSITPPDEDEPRTMQVNCAPFLDGRGHLMGAVAVFDDVSAWRRLDELKSQFVSTVAHEIASPLGAVLGQLQNLAQGLAGPLNADQRQLLDRARGRIEGIVGLSRDLLDLSRIEAGQRNEPSLVEIPALLAEALDVLAPQAEAKAMHPRLDLAGSLPPVRAVAGELSQVFINLLSNAIKYTPAQGAVTIAARRQGPELVIEFTDSGFGIPAEDLGNIFKRFYRVKDANTRHIVGTGLGLPIVKKLVEANHGRIEVQSQPGQGSTFRVILPAA